MNAMNNKDKKSPINEDDLQTLPGSYLRQKREDLFEDIISWFAMVLFAFVLTILEWFFYMTNTPRSPWVPTLLTIFVSILFYYKYKKYVKNSLNYSQGLNGEIYVGQILEGLRSKGYVPIHDVPCGQNNKKFNIDHILIGPKGIFSIETKTWSKSVGEKNIINYHNSHLYKNGIKIGIQSILQASSNSRWLEKLLFTRTGQSTKVSPVVVFPGWWIEKTATTSVQNEYDVLMLNVKVLDSFLDTYPDKFTPEEINKLITVVSSYVHEEASRE